MRSRAEWRGFDIIIACRNQNTAVSGQIFFIKVVFTKIDTRNKPTQHVSAVQKKYITGFSPSILHSSAHAIFSAVRVKGGRLCPSHKVGGRDATSKKLKGSVGSIIAVPAELCVSQTTF